MAQIEGSVLADQFFRADCTSDRHGTAWAYQHGCRCPDAREEQRLYRKRRRQGRAVPNRIPAIGVSRRLRALHAIGWSWAALGQHMGMSNDRVHQIAGRTYYVHRRTAERVSKVYAELSMTPGDSKRARAHAERQGWAPPLAWNEGALDDPTAQPEWGWNLPRVAKPTRPEKIAAVRQMTAKGDSLRTIAQVLGLTERQVSRYRKETK